jgi:hypothetical protein
MRWALMFNDLKPRAYYCSGGDTYWPSRFMKRVAVLFMELLKMSSKNRRSFPTDAARYVDDDDYIVIWDLASFTTNLSELRFFLYWCARYLECDIHVRQNPMRVFDSREGIIQANLWDLLDAYNEEVNCYASFSIHRILDLIGLQPDDDIPDIRHMNSGALGVLANIGFSTAFGGVHTSLTAKHDNAGCSIGDDVLAITSDDPETSGFLRHIRAIGDIAVEKFEIFGPKEYFEDDDGWKFVKRPFRRTSDGFSIGEQLNLPILAFVFGTKSPNRKFPQDNRVEARTHKFASQVASLLWDLQRTTIFVSDEDIELLRNYLTPAYRHLGLPTYGALPGLRINRDSADEYELLLALPSIRFEEYDPRSYDWAEYLWDSAPQPYALLPDLSPVPIFLEGLAEEIVTSTRFNRVWVDLGYYKEGNSIKRLVKVNSENKRVFQQILQGEGSPLVVYHQIKDLPVMFYTSTHELKNDPWRSDWYQD